LDKFIYENFFIFTTLAIFSIFDFFSFKIFLLIFCFQLDGVKWGSISASFNRHYWICESKIRSNCWIVRGFFILFI